MRRATCPSTAAQSAKPTATFERRSLPAQTFANHPRINANAWIPAFAGMTAMRRNQSLRRRARRAPERKASQAFVAVITWKLPKNTVRRSQCAMSGMAFSAASGSWVFHSARPSGSKTLK